ncbi:hypothetical protein M408DRAFT_30420 [Serendipita vermifera MAFF 305830]|uniref:Uncharacterized protein n=1 Tax=Serendipita vermifera MAFF 305830 TaxID=933852 RepID=A0A0C3AM45_SERVB|nr:hypothetical protein M408DRAFT_30420 [Serendipita vermifera MAFF 305830]
MSFLESQTNERTGFPINSADITIELDEIKLLDSSYLNVIRENDSLVNPRIQDHANRWSKDKRVTPDEKPKVLRLQVITCIKTSDSSLSKTSSSSSSSSSSSKPESSSSSSESSNPTRLPIPPTPIPIPICLLQRKDTSLSNSPFTSSVSSAQIHALHSVRFKSSIYSGESERYLTSPTTKDVELLPTSHMRNIATTFYDLTLLHQLRPEYTGGEAVNKQPPRIAVVNNMSAVLDGIQFLTPFQNPGLAQSISRSWKRPTLSLNLLSLKMPNHTLQYSKVPKIEIWVTVEMTIAIEETGPTAATATTAAAQPRLQQHAHIHGRDPGRWPILRFFSAMLAMALRSAGRLIQRR